MATKIIKSKMSSKYYGGDDYDENDEDSVKLLLKDCHQRQSALYSVNPLTHSSAGFFLNPLSRGELLYSSGQSRLHLYLREMSSKQGSRRRSTNLLKTSQFSGSRELNFTLFKKSIPVGSKVVDFPASIEEEAAVFRSHGFPLLVWPETGTKEHIQQYLDENYPDCAQCFRELDKTLIWLDEKWRPLSLLLGLNSSAVIPPTDVVLTGLSQNSVAVNFVRSRTAWNESYAALLQSFFLHRRISSPGFHHNPIHFQLQSMCNERLQAVSNDAGFFNIAGDRLLQLGFAAEAEGRKVELKIDEMASRIQDSSKRAQFLSVLLPISDLKKVISGKNPVSKRKTSDNSSYSSAKLSLMEALDSSIRDGDDVAEKENSINEMAEESSDDTSQSSGEAQDTKETPNKLSQVYFPNRPVTKEIMENRGIVKYRHKRERNPRVHLRQKFKKAQIRYKSRVPIVRKEDAPYAGELRGIRVNMIKSHKFKRNK